MDEEKLQGLSAQIDTLKALVVASEDSLNALMARVGPVTAARVPWQEMVIVLLLAVISIGLLLVFALRARKGVFALAADKDRLAEFAMKQTF